MVMHSNFDHDDSAALPPQSGREPGETTCPDCGGMMYVEPNGRIIGRHKTDCEWVARQRTKDA